MQKPRTNQELWGFIYAHFGIALPYRAYTPGHSSPFGFIADGFFNPGKDIAGWACRSGGKTLGSSILARLEFLFSVGLQGRVLSGSADQAKNLYGYWNKWVSTIYPQQLHGAPLIAKTKINGGKLEILTASQKSVRGPKVQRLYIDELDEVDAELVEAASGMLATRPGKPARTIYTSTWHRVGGSMGKLMDTIPGNGVTRHLWNIWECISQCGEERHEYGRNCGECPLGTDCLAARSQRIRTVGRGDNGTPRDAQPVGIAAERHGIFAVEDAIKRYRTLSRATIDAEYLCKRPSPDGMVYPAFDPHKHCVDKAPERLDVYRTIDWGYRTFVCLWIAKGKGVDAPVWLLDTYKAEDGTLKQHADYINTHPIKNIKATFCDPAGRQHNDQTGRTNMAEMGGYLGVRIRCRVDRRSTDVANGIKLVTNYIDPASGPPKFHIVDTPANRATVKALQSYENMKVNGIYIDKVKDPQEFEHIPDALRYFFINTSQSTAMADIPTGS